MNVDEFAQRFENPKPGRNGQYMVRCPCHEDKRNSLGIKDENGRIVLNCLAGCETEQILDAVGATWSDLFIEHKSDHISGEEYFYASDRLKKIRYYQPDGSKSFYWQHYVNGEWKPGRNNISPGLYCSCEKLSETVFLVGAEKAEKASNLLMALFKPLSEFEEEETNWLIPDWVPAGQIVLVVSDGGVGKTSLWVDIVAALSNGQPCILDPAGYERDPKMTIFCLQRIVSEKS